MPQKQTDGESIAEQIQREKKPFWVDEIIIAYKVNGNVFIFDDYSGIVNINGNKKKVDEAITEGTLCGRVLSFNNDLIFSLVPLVRTQQLPNGSYETKVDSVQICTGKTPEEWCKSLNSYTPYTVIRGEAIK